MVYVWCNVFTLIAFNYRKHVTSNYFMLQSQRYLTTLLLAVISLTFTLRPLSFSCVPPHSTLCVASCYLYSVCLLYILLHGQDHPIIITISLNQFYHQIVSCHTYQLSLIPHPTIPLFPSILLHEHERVSTSMYYSIQLQ